MSEITEPILLDSTGMAIKDAILRVASAIGGHGICYGFHVNGNDSNPATAVTYLEDAVGMESAKMDYTNGVFDYGSWVNPFFMPRPCMVRFGGTVDYYLDPNDLTKKIDGTDSDVANVSYEGNAMMEWGRDGKKIWVKVVPDTDPKSGCVYIADYQKDNDFHAYCFINSNGDYVDHFYTPIYNGSKDSSNRLRSISGLTVLQSANASAEITYAKANGSGWNTEVFCDIQLINFLLILMGKNLDTQETFGYGRCGYGGSASNMAATGLMNDKGMFWGQNLPNGTEVGVKVFGMEHYWGNQWRRFAGLINDNGNVKTKMCYGMSDGSTVDEYNLDGSGYVSTGIVPEGTSGGYISENKFVTNGAMLPATASGSQTTYCCDGFWFNNGQTDYACRGGACNNSLRVGAFCLGLHNTASFPGWYIGAAPSYKPLL